MKPEKRPYPGPAQITELSRNDVAIESLRKQRARYKLLLQSVEDVRRRYPHELIGAHRDLPRYVKELDEAIAMLTALPEPDALDVLRSAQDNGGT